MYVKFVYVQTCLMQFVLTLDWKNELFNHSLFSTSPLHTPFGGSKAVRRGSEFKETRHLPARIDSADLKLRGLSPRVNYTDRAAAAGRRS